MNNQNQKIPLFSIIVPIYNTSNFLRRCCDSLIKQDPNNICEFIMVNDGSKDNSIDILNEYAAKDSRFKIFTQSNQGAGIARNFGIKQAKGEYIGFLDSDDELSEDYSKVLSEIINSYQAEAIIFSTKTISVNGKKRIKKISDKIRNIATEYNNSNWFYISKLKPTKRLSLPYHTTILSLQRKLINERKIQFAESRINEDVTFTAIFQLTFDKIYICDTPLYINHERLGSLENTQITDLNILFTQLNSLDNVRNRFKLEGEMLNNYYDMLSSLCFKYLSKLSSSKKLRKEFLEKIEVYFSNEQYKEFRNYVKRKQLLNITNFINSKNERVKTLIIFGFYIPLWKKWKHNSNKN